jgi:Zn-dependent peptidase ImmA (M78 family)/DNA-binding XRE family transcriptional regulator
MGKSIEVKVNPDVLIWVRESIGYSCEDIAKKLNVKTNDIVNWEKGISNPTIAQLEKLANACKRPLAVFLLEKPPDVPVYPPSFRIFAEKSFKRFSPETMLVFRESQRIKKLLGELYKSLNYKSTFKKIHLNSLNNPEEVARKIRDFFDIPIEKQFKWKSGYDAFNVWKNKIESLGIIILQFNFDLEDARGFALADNQFPVIVINSKDNIYARIFSLFHEFSHILLDKTYVFNKNFEQFDLPCETKETEIFCNKFAGSFLVPQAEILRHQLVLQRDFTNECFRELSKDFCVSREVILRRLLDTEVVDKQFYEQKISEWRNQKFGEETKISGFPIDQAKKCINKKGIIYVSIVFEALSRGHINLSDASDYLGVKIKHFDAIHEKLLRKAALS